MKKGIFLLSICLTMLLFQGIAIAQQSTKELIFSWDQASDDLPSLAKWTLYIRSTSGGVKENQIDIPYNGGSGPFESSQPITVTGTAGSVVRKYFVLDATSKSGIHTAPSNEVFYDFQIPSLNVTTPLNLTIKVLTVPK